MDFTSILATGLGLLRRFWYVLPLLGLALALHFTRSSLAHVKEQRDTLASWQSDIRQATSDAAHIKGSDGKPALLAANQVGLQITYLGQGVDTLTARLNLKNEESRQRGVAYEQAVQMDTENQAAAARQYSAATLSIARLKGMAAAPDDGKCPADPTLLAELNGL